MSLMLALLPTYPPRFDIPQWDRAASDVVQDYFRIEYEYLMSRDDCGDLSCDLQLLGAIADLMRELAAAEEGVSDEYCVLTDLLSEVGFWSTLMPRCIVKTPVSAEAIAAMEKWKSGRGLEDFRELTSRVQRGLSDLQERLDSLNQRSSRVGICGVDEENVPRQRRLYRNIDC